MATPKKKSKEVDWSAVEALYLADSFDVGVRTLAKRLGVNESAMMARATRGQWASKRSAAKGMLVSPGLPVSSLASVADTSIEENTGDTGNQSLVKDGLTEPEHSLENVSQQTLPPGKLTPTEILQRASVVKAARAEQYEKAMAAQATRLPQIMAQFTDAQVVMNADKLAKLDAVARKSLGIDGPSDGRAPLVQIALLSGTDRGSVPKVERVVVSACESTESVGV